MPHGESGDSWDYGDNAGFDDALPEQTVRAPKILTQVQLFVGVASWVLAAADSSLALVEEDTHAVQRMKELDDFEANESANVEHLVTLSSALSTQRGVMALAHSIEQRLDASKIDGLDPVQDDVLLRYVKHAFSIADSTDVHQLQLWIGDKLGLAITDGQQGSPLLITSGEDEKVERDESEVVKQRATWEVLMQALFNYAAEMQHSDEMHAAADADDEDDSLRPLTPWRSAVRRVGSVLGLVQTGVKVSISPSGSAHEHHFILRHDSVAFQRFHTVFIALTAWDSIFAPVQLCFVERMMHVRWLAVFSIIFDIFYILRVLLRFRVTVVNRHSVVVHDPRGISRHYLSNDFSLDLLASWPHNFLAMALGTPAFVPFLLRLLRLVNLRYVSECLHQWRKSRSDDDLRSGLIVYLGVLLYTAHVSSCVWNLCSFSLTAQSSQSTWWEQLHVLETTAGAGTAREDATILQQYLVCLFFTMSMLTSLGIPTVPSNTFELVFFLCAMVLNMTVCKRKCKLLPLL
jgi:hypothetical protein